MNDLCIWFWADFYIALVSNSVQNGVTDKVVVSSSMFFRKAIKELVENRVQKAVFFAGFRTVFFPKAIKELVQNSVQLRSTDRGSSS